MKSLKNHSVIEKTESDNIPETSQLRSLEVQENTSDCDENLLNLLAEIITENIIRKVRNGCNRISKDQ